MTEMKNTQITLMRISGSIEGSGDVLRIKRISSGLSQRKLAKILNVCRRSLQNWEYNKRPVPKLISDRIHEIYEAIISGNGDKNITCK